MKGRIAGSMGDVTVILDAIDRGEPDAAEELLPLVYEELRKLATRRMASEPAGHTLQPTALVHEAWLRLAGEHHSWRGRKHFFCAAAEAMRRILVDRARRCNRPKHGAGRQRVPLEQIDVAKESDEDTLLCINDALAALEREEPEKAQLVKLRYFTGLRIPEAAEVMGISASTAKRYWVFARAWLIDTLKHSA